MPVEPASQPPPAPSAPPAPLALSYDELPAGSDLRREYHGDGAVTIISPAGEPSTVVRRVAAQRHALAAAAPTAFGIGAGLWALGPGLGRLDLAQRVLASGLVVVVAGGAFLLMWKVWYRVDLDRLTEARRESAVLHADRRRVLVEITGPGGDRSVELPVDGLGRITVAGWRRESVPIPHLKFERPDEPTLRVLGGRHPLELKWAADTLSQAMGQAGRQR